MGEEFLEFIKKSREGGQKPENVDAPELSYLCRLLSAPDIEDAKTHREAEEKAKKEASEPQSPGSPAKPTPQQEENLKAWFESHWENKDWKEVLKQHQVPLDAWRRKVSVTQRTPYKRESA